MKDILDAKFRYRPSFDTDVKKTFDRIRKEREKAEAETAKKVVATIKPGMKGRAS